VATIVIHAGMHKTGSTSIQRWIADNASPLRQEHDVQVLVAARSVHGDPSHDIRLVPYQSGAVNSSPAVQNWIVTKQPSAFSRRFIEDLARFATESAIVLVTAEDLSYVFSSRDESFLQGFEELAREHDVHVAYYVRPQHSAIEAKWKQSGYRLRGLSPSEWVLKRAQRWLGYAETLDAVSELAPHVAFEMRPFVSDLLDGGNPVEDFARRFLSLDEHGVDVHANPGFPLELVNVLRHAPEGWFWTRKKLRAVDRYPRRKISAVFDGLEIRESRKIRRSRLILQQHCHETFEPGNQRLIRRLGWPIANFVPAADDLEGGWTLDELDGLWSPEASDAERALLYHALRAALT